MKIGEPARGAARRRRLGLALACALLGGCASAPALYNEARDKQGQDLAKAVSEVELVAVVEAIQKKYDALKAAEADAQQSRAALTRDFEIAQVASEGVTLRSGYVEPFLDKRLQELLGAVPGAQEREALLAGVAESQSRAREVQQALRVLRLASGLQLQSCAEADARQDAAGRLRADVQVRNRPSAEALFAQLLAKCRQAAEPVEKPAAGSRLANAWADYRSDADQAERQRKQVNQLRAALKAAQENYDREVAALAPRPADAGYKARLMEAAGKLERAIGLIRAQAEKDNLGSAMAHAESIENLQALQQVADALAKGTADPADLTPEEKRAVAVIRLLPTLADEADALLKNAQRPKLAPLLLALEQQRLAVEGFEARGKLLEKKAALRRQRVEAMRQELLSLARARQALGPPAAGVKGATVDLDKPMSAITASNDADQKFALYASLAEYFDNGHRFRAESSRLELEALAVNYDVEMARSKTGALMWQSLLANMAAVLAEYHRSGIKAESLAEFVKGFGVFYLGHQAGK